MSQEINLSAWLQDIDRLVKEKSYLNANFKNTSEYFLGIINEILSGRRHCFGDYDRQLYEDLCNFLKNKNKAIMKCMPSAVNYIISFNYQFKIKGSQSDKKNILSSLRTLKRNLKKIRHAYDSKCLMSEIRKSVVVAPMSRISQKYLIELLKTKYGIKSVPEFIKSNLAQNFFDLHKLKIFQTLTKDNYTKENTLKIINELSNKLTASFESLEDEGNFEQCLKELYFDNSTWKSKQNFLVKESKSTLKVFNNLNISQLEDLRKISLTSQDTKKIKSLIIKYLEYIISQFIFWSLSSPHKNLYSSTVINLTKKEYFKNFSNLIKDSIDDKKNYHEHTFFIGESFLSEYSIFISEMIYKQIDSKFIEKEITNLVMVVCNLIQNKGLEIDLSLSYTVQDLLDYKLKIFEYLDNLTFRVLLWIRDNHKTSKIDMDNPGAFVLKLVKNLFRKLSSGKNIENTPMFIKSEIWSKLISSLIKKSQTTKKRPWKIIFLIGNLDCKGKIIKIGKTVIYDARKWDFGEDDFIDTSKNFHININEIFVSNFETFHINHRRDGINRNSARAVIYVDAVDEFNALDDARRTLIESINLLVLEFSDKTYGFRPQLPLYFQMTDLETNRVPSGFHREDVYGIFELDLMHQVILQTFDSFLSHAEHPKEQILLALEWHQKGQWDQSEHVRFASFWIALEKLLVDYSGLRSRSPEKILLHYIPKLTVTWRNTSVYDIIIHDIRRISNIIELNTDLKTKIKRAMGKDWNRDYAILENLDRIAKIANNVEIGPLVSNLADYMKSENKNKVKREIASKRIIEKFKVAYVHSVRNLLFHEAKIDQQVLADCNIILQNILYNLLLVIISENFDTLSKIIKHANRPYCK